MIRIEGYFELLWSTDSRLGSPEVHEDVLVVPFRYLRPVGEHPLRLAGFDELDGRMVFEGVVSSTREVLEYVSDTRVSHETREPREEQDGPFSAAKDPGRVQEFGFEGNMGFEGNIDSPKAWVTWTVLAHKFILEVDDMRKGVDRYGNPLTP